MVKFNSLTGWYNLVWVKIGTCVKLTIVTQSASWVGPSLHDGFTVPWIHHGTENCTYFKCTLGCALTHSIAIDLITSKVRYSLWFTAELFTYGLRAWLTHARYANSTNQTVRQTQVHSESSADQIMGSWHPGSAHMRNTLPSPDLTRDFKTSEFRRNCRATYGIVTRGPIHSNWKQYSFHLYKSITTVFIACHNP